MNIKSFMALIVILMVPNAYSDDHSSRKKGSLMSYCVQITYDNKVKNNCYKEVTYKIAPSGGEYTKDYPLKGLYTFHGSGMSNLAKGSEKKDPLLEVIQRNGKQVRMIACEVGFTPYFSDFSAFTGVCLQN